MPKRELAATVSASAILQPTSRLVEAVPPRVASGRPDDGLGIADTAQPIQSDRHESPSRAGTPVPWVYRDGVQLTEAHSDWIAAGTEADKSCHAMVCLRHPPSSRRDVSSPNHRSASADDGASIPSRCPKPSFQDTT